jgi:hypothetical protein
METQSTEDIFFISNQALKILFAVNDLSKDPYTQMAILKSATSIILSRLETASTKAAMTAAIANILQQK